MNHVNPLGNKLYYSTLCVIIIVLKINQSKILVHITPIALVIVQSNMQTTNLRLDG